MSYLVLARKSRPKTFKEVVGQKAVLRTLQNALTQNRVSHALIFSGVRGVGKTTLARIMAKALNCEKEHAPEPCNACPSCVDIHAGSSVDLVEIDGASNRGIQEIRELKENIRFMPTGSRYKIIIIDEVHMLTTEAFNALLKTLEEPPEHVYFMFATTELHRVPVTILSRCQRYELKRINSKELAKYFQSIADKEKVQIEPAALNIIVREAGGSVRDGLSLLDQVFSYCGDSVKAEEIIEILGLVGHQVISELAEALLARDISGTLEILDHNYTFGMDLKRFINDLLAWFRALVICSVSDDPRKLLDLPDDDLALLENCSARYSSQMLILIFNVLMENLEKASYSARPRYALEMALIKAVQAGEVVPVSAILGRLDDVLQEVASTEPSSIGKSGPEKKTPDTAAVQEKIKPVVPQHTEQQEEVVETSRADDTGNDPAATAGVGPGDLPRQYEGKRTAVQAVNKQEHAPPATEIEELHNRTVRQNWNDFIEYVRDRKPWMASALQMAKSTRLVDGVLVVEYENSVNCRMLRNRENITPLTEFASDFFQVNFSIRFDVPDEGACDVDPSSGNKVQQERQSLANDSLVLTAVDIFNGEVGDIRVGPRFRGPIVAEKDDGDNKAKPDDC